MGIEIDILNWIQALRTPVGDVIMSSITKLGNAGFFIPVGAHGDSACGSYGVVSHRAEKDRYTGVDFGCMHCVFQNVFICTLSD